MPDYASNQVCVECHPEQARQWEPSNHARASARARPNTVRGNFENATFASRGKTSRFLRRGDRFLIKTEGPDRRVSEFEVAYVIGYEPLQQYVIELPGGRLQAFTIAWDTNQRRWFDLHPDDDARPGDGLHWTGRYQNWNTMCAACHTTNLMKGYDAAADSYRTTWSDINVACQACHGPGGRHVEWARAGGRGSPAGLVVDLRARASEIDMCARCHARRGELTSTPSPGHSLLDDYLPALLTEGLYYPDGQQLDEVYVDGSFRQSKMYAAGVRCSDCHDPHSGAMRAVGNQLCVRCHSATPDARFAKAGGKTYDSPGHHFHTPGTPGAQCVSCHMPPRTYMTLDERRDHSLRVPRPDLTAKLGVPNACTGCHDDKPAAWAADAITRWRGGRPADRPHYGDVLAAGRAGQRGAVDALASLSRDAATPAIVRATALNLITRYNVDPGDGGLRDVDPIVRVAAVDACEGLPPLERVPRIVPLLSDPIRAVRIAAARVLAAVPRDQLDTTQRAALEAAIVELIASLRAQLDMPAANLNLGVVYEHLGQSALAETSYLRTLQLDPDLAAARVNLAQLYAGQSRIELAERVLSDGIRRQPARGELYFARGLLLAEANRFADAERALASAVRLEPAHARVRYNHALVLQRLGRRPEAERALVGAARLDPSDPTIVYAVAAFYAEDRAWPKALEWAQRFAALDPDDPQARQLIRYVQERRLARRVERALEIGLQIGEVLDADRKPDEAVDDAEFRAVLRRHARVRHDRRMLDQRFDTAERFGEREHAARR